MKIRPVGG